MPSQVNDFESSDADFMEKLTINGPASYEDAMRYASIVKERSNAINTLIEDDLDWFDLL